MKAQLITIPILLFLIENEEAFAYDVGHILKSDFFNSCQFFEDIYNSRIAYFILKEYIVSHGGFNTEEVLNAPMDTCGRTNLKRLKGPSQF